LTSKLFRGRRKEISFKLVGIFEGEQLVGVYGGTSALNWLV
jgi:hypothetical protein